MFLYYKVTFCGTHQGPDSSSAEGWDDSRQQEAAATQGQRKAVSALDRLGRTGGLAQIQKQLVIKCASLGFASHWGVHNCAEDNSGPLSLLKWRLFNSGKRRHWTGSNADCISRRHIFRDQEKTIIPYLNTIR